MTTNRNGDLLNPAFSRDDGRRRGIHGLHATMNPPHLFPFPIRKRKIFPKSTPKSPKSPQSRTTVPARTAQIPSSNVNLPPRDQNSRQESPNHREKSLGFESRIPYGRELELERRSESDGGSAEKKAWLKWGLNEPTHFKEKES